VRAARNLPQAHASRDYAVWGHSQGGHAALFTGEFAGVYAPELRLHGIAAGAPVPNLVDLFKVNVKTTVGKVLIAMALDSWQRVYHDASLSRIVTPAARPAVARIARHCLYGRKQVLASVLGALVLGLTFLSAPVWDTEPWRTIAEENTPSVGPVDVPMLVVQSGADTIVDPAVTRRYVDELCASARTVELRLYPGVGHVQTGHVAAPDVERWLAERFAGRPAPSTCG
jgi:alpha-beta hydrolase superfamily lysophospholipase